MHDKKYYTTTAKSQLTTERILELDMDMLEPSTTPKVGIQVQLDESERGAEADVKFLAGYSLAI